MAAPYTKKMSRPPVSSAGASRRRFLSAAFGAACTAACRPAWARAAAPLTVAYAGSMAPLMEGALAEGARAQLGIEVRGRAQGASALAQLIAAGSLRPDVFISVTTGPMRTVLISGKAAQAFPIAHTEMVIAYAPAGRFAQALARAGEAGQPPWWEVVQQPGFRLGRSDPRADPQGRNIIYVLQLAERVYRQPGLASRVLGALLNPRQLFAETMLEARLQSGQLDAAAAYRVQPGAYRLPFVRLAPEINLGLTLPPAAAALRLNFDGHTYRPEPLIYYAAALKQAPQPAAAAAYVRWLQAPQAQQILQQAGYQAAAGVPPLGGARA